MTAETSTTISLGPKRVLIILLGAIGDVVRALPLLGRMRRAWPKAHIAWAVEPKSQPIIEGHPWLGKAGLWFVPVRHEGNQNASPEEVERVAGLVDTLIQPGVSWIDDKGRSRPLRLDDILIVAPYNDQVNRLTERLPGAKVGTVDKFQGQEAAVVLISMTTSSGDDIPRDRYGECGLRNF